MKATKISISTGNEVHYKVMCSCLLQITGRGHLFAFNPITGEAVGNMVDGGQHLDFNIVQSFMLGEMDSQFLKGIVMVDESLKVCCWFDSRFELPQEKTTTICICETKGADQLRSYCEADQCLCFRHTDSTLPLLLKSKISAF